MKNSPDAKLKETVFTAFFAAVYVVLGFLSVTVGNVKLSFEETGIIIAALSMGPVSGFIAGGVGSFLYQMLVFGIEPVTVLWMLPYMACGLIAGFAAKKKNYFNTKKELYAVTALSEITVFILNTLALYADSRIKGYYSPAVIWGAGAVRLGVMAAKTVLICFILYPLLRVLRRQMPWKNAKKRN